MALSDNYFTQSDMMSDSRTCTVMVISQFRDFCTKSEEKKSFIKHMYKTCQNLTYLATSSLPTATTRALIDVNTSATVLACGCAQG